MMPTNLMVKTDFKCEEVNQKGIIKGIMSRRKNSMNNDIQFLEKIKFTKLEDLISKKKIYEVTKLKNELRKDPIGRNNISNNLLPKTNDFSLQNNFTHGF